ncbi:D-alanyl-D-alanine carboxypeptidase [Novosphingobium sp. FSY-8]|uniref:serine-type D-Ala-D-Ala carboxypeptidase n=2 Tax=Novosphingobium ovatum TaxID=1908523 RepID=A0ABW9XCP0_9SPHN|nr:D-alanyl-D-alanine carboxypeptidase [Novosphingobium ovatum]
MPAPGPGEPAPPPAAEGAPVAMLVDMTSGRVLYARDAERPFLPASVTKTMTAFVAFELMAQGKLRADQMIPVRDETWAEWHTKGSRMFLERGSSVSVENLLLGIMNVSANDAAVVLAEGAAGSVPAWTAMMNDAARRLGMTNSHFGTPNGWMDNGVTHVSAHDLVRLAEAMIDRYPEYYHHYVGRPGMRWNDITQDNHDPILGKVRGVDGIKTGFTGEARYNYLSSAERDGRRLVMVVAGIDKPGDRRKVAESLLEWGFTAWTGHKLYDAGALVGDAQVQGGKAAHVGLVAPRNVMATLPTGAKSAVMMRVVYQGPLVAPIKQGAPVAELELRTGDGQMSRVPLLAAADVPVGGALDRLRAGFSRLWR